MVADAATGDEGRGLGHGQRLAQGALSPVVSALALVWKASPGRALVMLGIEVAASVALLIQILLINQVLTAILELGQGSPRSLSSAVLPISLLAALTALNAVLSTIVNLEQRVLGEMVGREVWRRILDVSRSVDLEAYEDPHFYDQAERVHTHAASQTQIVVNALVILIGDALGAAGATIALVSLAPALLPLLLLSGVPIFLTSRVSGRREFGFAAQQSPRARERTYLREVLTQRQSASEIRAYSLAAAFRRRWETNYSVFLVDLQNHVNRRLRLSVIGHLFAALLTAGSLFLAAALVNAGVLSVASAGAVLVAIRLLGSRVSGVNLGLSTVMESSLFMQDLRRHLQRAVAPVPTPPDAPTPAPFHHLALSDVTFTYPGASRPAVRGISLDIHRGQVVALVGENGSGKSTLAKLLSDLYEPDEGSITWDGVDLRELSSDLVRRRIAVVFQDFARYKLTARENIALGVPEEDADDDAIREAARYSEADSFIADLAGGYETILSKEYDGGSDLSVGQWQRIALARAFLRNAPFIILDEPSASLDARAEHALFERIRSLVAGRTVLVISHRLSTVRSADRIYVLDQGQIVEEGDHASLMEQEGVYCELFRLQARGYTGSASWPRTNPSR